MDLAWARWRLVLVGAAFMVIPMRLGCGVCERHPEQRAGLCANHGSIGDSLAYGFVGLSEEVYGAP